MHSLVDVQVDNATYQSLIAQDGECNEWEALFRVISADTAGI